MFEYFHSNDFSSICCHEICLDIIQSILMSHSAEKKYSQKCEQMISYSACTFTNEREIQINIIMHVHALRPMCCYLYCMYVLYHLICYTSKTYLRSLRRKQRPILMYISSFLNPPIFLKA